MTYLHNGEFDLGIQKLLECIQLSEPQESTLPKAYAMLCGCYLGKRDYHSARAALDTGLALKPNDAELLFRSANLYHDLGDNAAAERFYQRLFNRPPAGQVDSLDITMVTYKGRHNYALALTDMGRFDDAEAQLRTGLASNPAFSPSWHALGDLFVRRRRFDDARGVIEKLEGMDAQRADALRARLAEAMGVSVI
jgi:tetratricopeptide (TPR) repeat protein